VWCVRGVPQAATLQQLRDERAAEVPVRAHYESFAKLITN
jgi:hypothetical protein